jgi:hypothetical protein
MNKKALFLFLFLPGLLILPAYGQFSLGPKIGLSYTNLGGDLNKTRLIPSAFVGGMMNYDFPGVYSIQTGVLLSGKGSTLYYDETDKDAFVISYLEIPFNNVFSAEVGSGRLQFFGGPYVAYAVNAMYKYLADEDDMKEKIRIGTSPQDEIKPWDIGFNAGIGFIFEGLEVQSGYGASFTDISNTGKERIFNRIIFFSLAYYIRLEASTYSPRSRR